MNDEQATAVQLCAALVTALSGGEHPASEDNVNLALDVLADASRTDLMLALLYLGTTHVVAMRHWGFDPTDWTAVVGLGAARSKGKADG